MLTLPRRNAALSHARDDTILFADDDCLVPHSWCADMAAALPRTCRTGRCPTSPGSAGDPPRAPGPRRSRTVRRVNVVVAGGAGFLGAHLCRRLLGDGCAVVCVDNLLTGSYDNVAALTELGLFRFVRRTSPSR